MTGAEFTGMLPQLVHQVCVCVCVWVGAVEGGGVGGEGLRRDQFWCVYWGNVYTCIISPIILKVWKNDTKIIVSMGRIRKYTNTSFYYGLQGGGRLDEDLTLLMGLVGIHLTYLNLYLRDGY